MKLRKIAAAVLSLTIMCGAVPFSNVLVNDSAVFAESEYTEGTYGPLTYKNYGDYIEISDCDESATKVEIPSEIDGSVVTVIGELAFSDCILLSSVNISNGVKYIGGGAFMGCDSLASISIPDSVTDIGAYAFTSTTWLEKRQQENPLVVINNILIDGKMCEGDVVIPDGVMYIGNGAFANCNFLDSITIPNSVVDIGDNAFLNCISLSSVTLSKNVREIGLQAFWGCNALMSVKILNPDCGISDTPYTFSNGYEDVNYNSYYNGIIYGYENSTAQSYAEKYGYKFESLGEYVAAILGDTDGDGVINSSDASNVLTAYALIATGGDSPFTDEQMKAADVNNDGAVDSSDASSILAYYAFTATGGTGALEEFLG